MYSPNMAVQKSTVEFVCQIYVEFFLQSGVVVLLEAYLTLNHIDGTQGECFYVKYLFSNFTIGNYKA